MRETKITKERIRNHFTYGWWKYALMAVVVVVGWNLIYTATAYRAPKDRRLDVYFVTHSVAAETTDWVSAQILSLFPEVEDSNCVSIVYTDDDNYYGSIQLTTYIGAGEGDIYLMTRERFDAFKAEGAFLALDEAVASGALNLRAIDTAKGMATITDTGERVLAGIPADELFGFMGHGVDNRDLVICVMGYTQNEEYAVRFVNWLVETMQAEKPDWLVEQEAAKQSEGAAQGVSEMPSY